MLLVSRGSTFEQDDVACVLQKQGQLPSDLIWPTDLHFQIRRAEFPTMATGSPGHTWQCLETDWVVQLAECAVYSTGT